MQVVRGSTTSDTSDTIAVNNSRVVGEMINASDRFIILSDWEVWQRKHSDYKAFTYHLKCSQVNGHGREEEGAWWRKSKEEKFSDVGFGCSILAA